MHGGGGYLLRGPTPAISSFIKGAFRVGDVVNIKSASVRNRMQTQRGDL